MKMGFIDLRNEKDLQSANKIYLYLLTFPNIQFAQSLIKAQQNCESEAMNAEDQIEPSITEKGGAEEKQIEKEMQVLNRLNHEYLDEVGNFYSDKINYMIEKCLNNFFKALNDISRLQIQNIQTGSQSPKHYQVIDITSGSKISIINQESLPEKMTSEDEVLHVPLEAAPLQVVPLEAAFQTSKEPFKKQRHVDYGSIKTKLMHYDLLEFNEMHSDPNQIVKGLKYYYPYLPQKVQQDEQSYFHVCKSQHLKTVENHKKTTVSQTNSTACKKNLKQQKSKQKELNRQNRSDPVQNRSDPVQNVSELSERQPSQKSNHDFSQDFLNMNSLEQELNRLAKIFQNQQQQEEEHLDSVLNLMSNLSISNAQPNKNHKQIQPKTKTQQELKKTQIHKKPKSRPSKKVINFSVVQKFLYPYDEEQKFESQETQMEIFDSVMKKIRHVERQERKNPTESANVFDRQIQSFKHLFQVLFTIRMSIDTQMMVLALTQQIYFLTKNRPIPQPQKTNKSDNHQNYKQNSSEIEGKMLQQDSQNIQNEPKLTTEIKYISNTKHEQSTNETLYRFSNEGSCLRPKKKMINFSAQSSSFKRPSPHQEKNKSSKQPRGQTEDGTLLSSLSNIFTKMNFIFYKHQNVLNLLTKYAQKKHRQCIFDHSENFIYDNCYYQFDIDEYLRIFKLEFLKRLFLKWFRNQASIFIKEIHELLTVWINKIHMMNMEYDLFPLEAEQQEESMADESSYEQQQFYSELKEEIRKSRHRRGQSSQDQKCKIYEEESKKFVREQWKKSTEKHEVYSKRMGYVFLTLDSDDGM